MKRVIILLLSLSLLFASNKFNQVDDVINNAINSNIMPGATVAIGTADSLIYHKAYGTFTYAGGSTAVETNSLFDLASLTKVFATSMCMMKCIDSGLVSPEDYVKDFIPEFNNNGKGVIKVKHLLMHNSGLPSYTSAASTRAATLNKIYNISMSQSLGTYTYSCLNMITAMRVVEEATGMMMWEFYKEYFTDPMGLENSMFCPEDSLHPRCLPTTSSLQGSVHDPLAAGLDGYSGNAGLFSTSGDLAKLCQLMLNHGSLDGIKYVDSSTVVPFTTLQSSGGSRAYGWGINGSSAGSLMSPLNYGHTGYTGTSAYIDPTRELFVVILTNRVYPNDQASVSSTRKAVADAAVKAFDGLPDQARLHTIKHQLGGSWKLNWNFPDVMDSVLLIEKFEGSNSGNHIMYPADSLCINLEAIDCFCQRSVEMVGYSEGKTSDTSDTYYFKEAQNGKMALIVDGYDRVSNDLGWNLPYHDLSKYYANSLPDFWGYTTCDNQAVIDGDIELSDYNCVLWFCGDESVGDETFSSIEQTKVKAFLEAGGNLFVSGSEIGYDLSGSGSSEDRAFYNDYLKTKYLGDDANDLNGYGVNGTRFEGYTFKYGNSSAVYQEDFPDLIYKMNGSDNILLYSKYARAGIAYIGPFGTSTDTGKVVSLGFPYETIVGEDSRDDLMERIITLFEADFEVGVEDIFGVLPENFELKAAYPNPFNPTTTLNFTIPDEANIELAIYNANGQCVDILANKNFTEGNHSYIWNATNFPSGVYFANLRFEGKSKVQKLILMK